MLKSSIRFSYQLDQLIRQTPEIRLLLNIYELVSGSEKGEIFQLNIN